MQSASIKVLQYAPARELACALYWDHICARQWYDPAPVVDYHHAGWGLLEALGVVRRIDGRWDGRFTVLGYIVCEEVALAMKALPCAGLRPLPLMITMLIGALCWALIFYAMFP